MRVASSILSIVVFATLCSLPQAAESDGPVTSNGQAERSHYVLHLDRAWQSNDQRGAISKLRWDPTRREPWNTNRMHGQPDAADAYRLEVAFPKLTFVEPLAMTLLPGGERFCVATRSGKIYTFPIRRDVGEADLLMDLGQTVYGIAFHPEYIRNGLFYVSHFPNPHIFTEDGARLSEFKVTQTDPPKAEANNGRLLLQWPSGGHNGGCIRFGPEGYLYLSTGDASGIADSKLTGQDISDLPGSILRIDVNHTCNDARGGALAYAIPSDNPFVAHAGARGEVWSYGHRHVWKFQFDRQSRLWAGDVGQDLWESIQLVQRGSNFGWSVHEGGHSFRPDRKVGPTPIEPPLVEHNHADFRSITGGVVSYSSRLPELDGAYVYGDYDTGKIWKFRYDGRQLTEHQQLADTQLRIVEFGQDADGDVYVVDFVGGQIHRLVPVASRNQDHGANTQSSPETPSLPPFPRKLSETGLFADTASHLPAAGLIPYSVNAPLWSDGAEKERYLALPGMSTIERDVIHYPHPPNYPDMGWRFPDGTVLMKTFTIALDADHPEVQHRLETRILRFRQLPGDEAEYGAQVWDGYTYVWNEQQTDAELLDSRGADRELVIRDAAASGGQRKQTWHFPSRSECALCHNMAAKYALGVTTLQLNKQVDYGDGQPRNQLAEWDRLGVFKPRLGNPPDQLPALVDYRDPSQSLDLRARAYLHANCAHCHRKWGGGNAEFELQASLPLNELGIVDARATHGSFDIPAARLLSPTWPDRSILLHRMEKSGLGHMPHIGSLVIDQDGCQLIRQWISSLQTQRQLNQRGALRPRTGNVDSSAYYLPALAERYNTWLVVGLLVALFTLRWSRTRS